MPLIQFDQVGISALAAAVPTRIIDNYAYAEHFPADEVRTVVNKTGIKERRFADSNTTSSDLCFAACEKLLTDLKVDKNEVDLLVFVSQTPDFRMPATSILLQHRLGLPSSTMAFDINLGCSGFIYGLSVVYALVQNGGVRKALLLDGETRSKVYSPKDRKTAFLFGDGGVAALIETKESFGKSYFSLNSDGSRGHLIKINAGGYRNPSSHETLVERVVDEFGNIRSDEHGHMEGPDVFSFVLREVPVDFKRILKAAGIEKESIDYFLFHQANSLINEYLSKKLQLTADRVPTSLERFGNTSSVSIPLTIVTQLQHALKGNKKLLLSAFGVGLSWATAVINLVDCHVSDLVEI